MCNWINGKNSGIRTGLWPQRKCCRLIKTRVYTTKCRISNMEQVVPKLCTRNLNIQQITWRTQDYLFAGKLKIDKLKIKYCSMLAARGSRLAARCSIPNAVSPASRSLEREGRFSMNDVSRCVNLWDGGQLDMFSYPIFFKILFYRIGKNK